MIRISIFITTIIIEQATSNSFRPYAPSRNQQIHFRRSFRYRNGRTPRTTNKYSKEQIFTPLTECNSIYHATWEVSHQSTSSGSSTFTVRHAKDSPTAYRPLLSSTSTS